MEEHEVLTVEAEEKGTFKGEMFCFKATYEYCSNLDEYSETEETMKSNSLNQKDQYRRRVGLLTSHDIKSIRKKYGISQKEFSEVLGWGVATITRYENHQVQDRAHDDILRKINSDPKWFLEMLERAKNNIVPKYYKHYYQKASEQLKKLINPYTSINVKTSYYYDKLSISFEKMNREFYKTHSYNTSLNCKNLYNKDAIPIQSLIPGAA